MISPEKYSVWLCKFELTDKPGAKKVRPAVILDSDDEDLIVLLIKITSHVPRENFQGEIVISDIDTAGLVKPSTIRCSQIINAGYDDLLKPLGYLSEVDKSILVDALKEIGVI